jgi:hypothetical protein
MSKRTDVRKRNLGKFITDPSSSQDVLLDMDNAVLLDGMSVCLVNAVAGLVDKTQRGVEENIRLAVQLDGRINKSTDRASVLFVMDEDGAAAIISEILALATRIGPEFAVRLMDRISDLQSEGHVQE